MNRVSLERFMGKAPAFISTCEISPLMVPVLATSEAETCYVSNKYQSVARYRRIQLPSFNVHTQSIIFHWANSGRDL